ncbi:MAG: MMPL family transporter [Deltaproteobacteria bacterium]|nr:MMPL family transporter [Deltaproteobacteria bacterium]
MSDRGERRTIYERLTNGALRLSRRHRLVTLLALGLTCWALLTARRLSFNTDLAALLPEDHPDLKALRRVQEVSGGETGFMVLLNKNYLFAVSDDGTAHRYDGRRWHRDALGVPLHAVHGASPLDVAAGGARGAVFLWNGSRWTEERAGHATVRGLWGTHAKQLWAVGDGGAAWHRDSQGWRPHATGTRHHLRAVTGLAPSEVYAVGDGGTILRFESGRWSREESGTQVDLHGVSVAADGTAFAVGGNGLWLTRDRTGGWRRLKTPATVTLRAIWASSAERAWAVGDRGTILGYDGDAVRAEHFGLPNQLLGASGAGEDLAWTVGESCAIVRRLEVWRAGPADDPRTPLPPCTSRLTAVFRPAPQLDPVFARLPALAAALERLPLVSRVDYRKPVQFFSDRALYWASPEELQEVADLLEETLDREAAGQSGLYVEVDERDQSRRRERLKTLFGQHAELVSRFGRSEWYLHPDQASVGLAIFPKQGSADVVSLSRLQRDIEGVIARENLSQVDAALRVEISGDAPNKIKELGAATRDILGVTWPAIAGILLLIALYVRSGLGMLVTFVPLALSVAWTAGVTTVAFGALNAVTGYLFAVVFGLGIDYGLQLYGRYVEERSAGLSVEEAIDRTVAETGRAILTSSSNTAAALYTLCLMDFKGFSEFGFIAGTGILLSLFAYLVLLPALLRFGEGTRLLRLPARTLRPPLLRASFLGRVMQRWSRPILLVSGAATLFGAWGLFRLNFEYDQNVLRPVQPYDEVQDRSAQSFGESFTPTLLRAASRHELVAALDAIERRRAELGSRSAVRRTVSILDLVPTRQPEKRALLDRIGKLLRDSRWRLVDEKTKRRVKLESLRQRTGAKPFDVAELPEGVRRIFRGPGFGDAWVAMVYYGVNLSDTREARRFKQQVGTITGTPWVHVGSILPPGARAVAEQRRLVVACPPTDSRCADVVAKRLRDFAVRGQRVFDPVLLRDEAEERGLAVPGGLGGDVLAIARPGWLPRAEPATPAVVPSGTFHVASGELVLTEVVDLLLREGWWAILLSMLVVLGSCWFDFRSVWTTLLAGLPLLLGFLWTFGLMHFLGMRINIYNFVVLPALLGIGEDYGVHYLHRYHERGAGGVGAVQRSLFRVIFYCAATTVLGFGNMAFASHPGLRSLGLLAIIGLCAIFIAGTFTLPALLQETERARARREPPPGERDDRRRATSS